MRTKKLGAAVVTTIIACIPFVATHAAATAAVRHHATRSATGLRVGSRTVTAANICVPTSATQGERAAVVHTATNSAPNAWASRLSGLPFGGAAAYNPAIDGDPAQYRAAPDKTVQNPTIAPNAWASRLSGLPSGGAALCV